MTMDLVDDKRLLLFARLFGVALVSHVVGNWSQPDIPSVVGWVNLIVGGVGLVLLWRPAKGLLIVAAAAVLASVLLEMPFTGNHWVLAGLVAAAILASRGRDFRIFPAARVILLVFYVFAAFAKLNSGFFDPSVSCAVFYANQSLAGFGLPPLGAGGILPRALIWMTVAIELSVPLTLIWRRTRYVGVMIGTLFHTIISFDLNQHFYDFTAVLIALFVLFLPNRAIVSISEHVHRFGGSELVLAKVLLGVAGLLVLMAVSPLTPATAFLLSRLPFALWIPLSLLWALALIRARSPGEALDWRVSVGGALVVLITIMNGLTPYTEVKTAYSFNMYANLVTSQGRSNHYLIPRTWPLRNGYDGPVEILQSSDEVLNAYRDEGYLVAYPQLRRYLSLRPDVSLTYRRYGVVGTISEASLLPDLVDPGPWWWRFFALRAVDTRNPPRCQAAFLGAL